MCLLYWHIFSVTMSRGCLLLSPWDLLMKGLSVSACADRRHWKDQRTPFTIRAPHRNAHPETCLLIFVQCCGFLAFVFCPIQVLLEVVNEVSLSWKEVLKYNPNSRRSLEFSKVQNWVLSPGWWSFHPSFPLRDEDTEAQAQYMNDLNSLSKCLEEMGLELTLFGSIQSSFS